MAATPEKKVKQKVGRLLDEYQAYYFSPVTGGFGRSGVPDIIACVRGQFIGIECKAGTNVPTALQLREMNRIREAAGLAIVVNENNLDELKDLLERVVNG